MSQKKLTTCGKFGQGILAKKWLFHEKRRRCIWNIIRHLPLERPVKKQRAYYSGKKKRHTIKAQLIVHLTSRGILSVVCGKGRTHDFKLLKQSKLRILSDLEKYADSGYQGLDKRYANSFTPIKKPRGRELTPAEKAYNRALARIRIVVEHVNRWCKIFRSVKETYRGKHKNYSKVWTVVAALLNLRYTE